MITSCNVNNKTVSFEHDAEDSLLTVLRKNGYVEVHNGCEEGECGACTVLLDDLPVNSCQIFTASIAGRKILTVRSLGDNLNLHPIQQAFMETGAIQCGFCTPAKILITYSLLQNNPHPTDQEIRKAFDGTICRCTGYIKIIEAVKLAAERMHKK